MWKKTIGLDGETYDSASEAKVADWLFSNGIDYEPHKRLPKPSRGVCDFYLPMFDLWVEYDGLMEVRVGSQFKKKQALYKQMGLNLLVITRGDWKRALSEQIEMGC